MVSDNFCYDKHYPYFAWPIRTDPQPKNSSRSLFLASCSSSLFLLSFKNFFWSNTKKAARHDFLLKSNVDLPGYKHNKRQCTSKCLVVNINEALQIFLKHHYRPNNQFTYLLPEAMNLKRTPLDINGNSNQCYDCSVSCFVVSRL